MMNRNNSNNNSPESNRSRRGSTGSSPGAAANASSSTSPKPPAPGMVALAHTFVPGEFDVICGRGKAAKDHPGNRWYRSLIEESIQEYSECETKLEKSFMVSKLLKRVRTVSPEGGFVKCVVGRYWEVGDRLSREKIGQSYRDMLHTQYKSSTKAKATVRRQRAEQEGVVSVAMAAAGEDDSKTKARKLEAPQQQTPRKSPKRTDTGSLAALQPPFTQLNPQLHMETSAESPSVEQDPMSLSNLGATLSQVPTQPFPPLPNLTHCLDGEQQQDTALPVVGNASLQHNMMIMNGELAMSPVLSPQQQQQWMEGMQLGPQQQHHPVAYIQAHGSSGSLSFLEDPLLGDDSMLSCSSTMGEEHLHGQEELAAALQQLPSASMEEFFGSASIWEMYQGPLFSSDQTMEANNSNQE